MSVDWLREDPEYVSTFLQLIELEAERRRQIAETLYGAGYEPVPVVGQESEVWKKGGRLLTRAAAVREVEAKVDPIEDD